MGLLLYSQPSGATQQSGESGWTPVGADSPFAAVAQPFRNYTARTSSGAVDTDPVSDSIYLAGVTGIPGVGEVDKHTLTLDPIAGDDYIGSMTFHIRAWNTATKNLRFYLRRASVNTLVQTFTLTTTPTEFTYSSNTDPITSAPWAVENFAPAANHVPYASYKPYGPTEIHFEATIGAGATQVFLGRVYVEISMSVGPTMGKVIEPM